MNILKPQNIFDNRQSFYVGISNNIFENSRFLDTKEEAALNLYSLIHLLKTDSKGVEIK